MCAMCCSIGYAVQRNIEMHFTLAIEFPRFAFACITFLYYILYFAISGYAKTVIDMITCTFVSSNDLRGMSA